MIVSVLQEQKSTQILEKDLFLSAILFFLSPSNAEPGKKLGFTVCSGTAKITIYTSVHLFISPFMEQEKHPGQKKDLMKFNMFSPQSAANVSV